MFSCSVQSYTELNLGGKNVHVYLKIKLFLNKIKVLPVGCIVFQMVHMIFIFTGETIMHIVENVEVLLSPEIYIRNKSRIDMSYE